MRARVMASAMLLVAAFSWVAPVGAAITEKAAVKQVKAAAKSRLGVLATALAAARVTVVARVDAFEVAAGANGFSVGDVQDLVDDLAAFQAAVQEALFRVAVDTAADGQAALAALAAGAPLPAIPLALANAPGGVPDQVRAAVARLLAKTYRVVNRRLAKAGHAIGKEGDGTLLAALGPPPQLSFAFSEERGDAILFDFAIDLRVSASTLLPDETRLWVGGTTAVAAQDLFVSAVPMSFAALGDDQMVTSGARGRFLALLGDAVTLPRTNYLVGAAVGFAASASSSFAIR